MKKIYLSILSVVFALTASAQTEVTFNVTFPLADASPDGVHVAGNFYDRDYDGTADNPDYFSAATNDGNWDPNLSALTLTDMGGGMYSITLNLVAGRYEYKFVNGNDWPFAEAVPSACTVEVNGNGNRQIMVGADPISQSFCYGECADCGQNSIRVRVDMSTYDDDGDGIGGEPNEDINPDGMFMNGSFVEWSTFVPLQDWDGNKVWEGLITTYAADPIEFKFINGPDWIFPNESVSGACGAGNGNRLVTITDINTVLPVYCWSSCDPCSQPVAVTFSVDMNASCADTSPGINLMGTLTDWANGAAMSDDDGDGIWTLTLNLSAGSYEYKFRIGSGGWEGIGNRQLTVVADTPTELPVVCFNSSEPCGPVVAPADVTFEVRPGALQLATGQVMWVMGDFTQPNWQDGALQMTDTEGDGTWSVTVPQVCISSIFYKFRAGTPGGADFIEETADFTEIGGCGVDNGTFSDNRQLVRADGNPVTVCWTFDTCESCAGPASVSENNAVVSNLRVYPIPAEEILNVQFDAAVAARMTMRMVNSLGQVVVEENLGQVSGQKTLTVNTSNLASGVYSLSLTNGSHVQLVNVLIK